MIQGILAGAGMIVLAGTAVGQDVVAGARVAHRYCTGCHQTGRTPDRVPGIAPSFVQIANDKASTRTSIEVFLNTPHEGMPNYIFSPKDIADVAAYIVSLRSPESDRPIRSHRDTLGNP